MAVQAFVARDFENRQRARAHARNLARSGAVRYAQSGSYAVIHLRCTSLDGTVADGRILDVAMTSQGRPQESLIQNWAAKGAICAGAVGAIVGLIVGLFAYAPTAWAAMFEVGMPAFVLGALLGAISGAVATALRRVRA